MKKDNKKIGTITFHWAANYGAVLQAFALQRYLERCGHETEIIDYVPGLTSLLIRLTNIKNRNKDFGKKARKIDRFRRKELKLSSKRYFNNISLMDCENKYSAVICGSDQIWNPTFTMPRRFTPNLSYFLDFAGDSRRISYAASFGANKIPQKMKEHITPQLEKFEKLGVRENTGAEILKGLGLECEIVADPTLLLTAEDYSALLEGKPLPEAPKVFSYILHENQQVANDIAALVGSKLGQAEIYSGGGCGVYEWLSLIRDSSFTVTNSFHGTIFALLFHKPFVSVPVKGLCMNDRIRTLLSAVGLETRIVREVNEDILNDIFSAEIDWAEVDKKIEALRAKSAEFLSDI